MEWVKLFAKKAPPTAKNWSERFDPRHWPRKLSKRLVRNFIPLCSDCFLAWRLKKKLYSVPFCLFYKSPFLLFQLQNVQRNVHLFIHPKNINLFISIQSFHIKHVWYAKYAFNIISFINLHHLSCVGNACQDHAQWGAEHG